MTKAVSNIFIQPLYTALPEILSTGSYTSVFVLSDENTIKHCYAEVLSHLPLHHIIQIPSGEEQKTLATCELIWKKLTDANADRKAVLINLGGGVIGDMGGFAASCYKRGIAFINIPTTLLAMVDASAGGKTGIDFMGFKNQVGVFSQPAAVVIHTPFLQTLSERELRSGFAEVIKHYLIADKKEFEKLATRRPTLTKLKWDSVVSKNIKIKNSFVKKDPFEQNIRKALNFGHTIGHGVESYFLKDEMQKLLHGEAIAIGMITESYVAEKKGSLTRAELESITTLIRHYYKLPAIPQAAYKDILTLMRQDKKNTGTTLKLTLLNSIGNFSVDNTVEEDIITEAIDYYNTLTA